MGKTDNKHLSTIYDVANGDKYFQEETAEERERN